MPRLLSNAAQTPVLQFRSEGERMAATLEKNLAKFKEGGKCDGAAWCR